MVPFEYFPHYHSPPLPPPPAKIETSLHSHHSTLTYYYTTTYYYIMQYDITESPYQPLTPSPPGSLFKQNTTILYFIILYHYQPLIIFSLSSDGSTIIACGSLPSKTIDGLEIFKAQLIDYDTLDNLGIMLSKEL